MAKVPSPGNTIIISLCGQDHGWDTKISYVHLCSIQVREVDQDWNNCMNQLAAYREQSGGTTNLSPARTRIQGIIRRPTR